MAKSKGGMRFSYQIVDCARIRFSSVCNRRSARTGRRPRKRYSRSSMCSSTPADVAARRLRAARANRVFRTDEKHIGTENTVIVKDKDGAEFLSRNLESAAA